MAETSVKLTDMRITSAISRVSAPVVASNLLQTAVEWVSLAMIGSLGAEALAAVGFGRGVFWWASSALWAVGMAVMALVARSIGRDEPERARATLLQALLMGVILSSVIALAGALTARRTLPLLGATSDVVELGVPYLRVMFLSMPFLVNAYYAIFALRAAGETPTTLLIQGTAAAIQLVLTAVLVFGFGRLEPLGLLGAGLAVAISRAYMLVAVLVALLWGRTALRMRLNDFRVRPDWPLISTIVKVSIPNAIEYLGADTQRLLLVKIIAATSAATYAVSAVTVGRQVEELFGMVGMALSIAAGTLVGQNLGAGKPEQAEESAVKTHRITAALFGAVGLLFILMPGQIMGLFSQDAQVIQIGGWYLRMLGLVSPLYAASLVYAGALRGAADTRSPMKVTLTCLWVCQLPLAYVLALYTPAGIYGVYASYVLFWTVGGLWLRQRFRRGLWKQIAL
jgi:putative MATE family efflux protein